MSATKRLKIYGPCREIVKLVTEKVRHFPRDYRPTLGRRMQNEAVSLVLYVYRANAAEIKTDHIGSVLESAQVLDMLLQTSFDLELINCTVLGDAMDLVEDIITQAKKWQRWAENSNVKG